MMTQRTPAEIADLKEQWRSDGSWDIWETEGFEAHATELRAYADEVTAQWQRAARESLEHDMRAWCCNEALAQTLQNLLTNVTQLTAENARLRDRLAAVEFRTRDGRHVR